MSRRALPGLAHHGSGPQPLLFVMDVRCDRCQTEYELDDDSVAERGASVQCTTCGHTFVVSRQKPAGATPGPTTEMAAPAWVLTTEEGQDASLSRSDDAAEVDRRAPRRPRTTGSTRAGRERTPARRHGRVAAVLRSGRSGGPRVGLAHGRGRRQPETPQGLSVAARGYASPDEDDDDVLMGAPFARRRAAGPSRRAPRFGHRGGSHGRWASTTASASCCRSAHGPATSPSGIVFAGTRGRGGLVGSARQVHRVDTTAPAAAPDRSVRAPPAAPPPAAPSAAAPPPSQPRRRPRPPRPRSRAGRRAAGRCSARAAAAPARRRRRRMIRPNHNRRAHVVASSRAAAAPPPTDAPVRGRGYEQLVAEADRALENGNTAKAQKLIDEALQAATERRRRGDQLRLSAARQAEAARRDRRVQARAQPLARLSAGAVRPRRGVSRGRQPAQAIDAYKKLPRRPRRAARTRPPRAARFSELREPAARPSHSATATVPGQGSAPPPMPTPSHRSRVTRRALRTSPPELVAVGSQS